MAEAAAIQVSAPIERLAPDTFRLERTLDAPVETVWRGHLRENLAAAEIELSLDVLQRLNAIGEKVAA